jgi:hypothetical protein
MIRRGRVPAPAAAALACAALAVLPARAAGQEHGDPRDTAAAPRTATAQTATHERSLPRDGVLYARLLDLPPFVLGDPPLKRPALLPALYVGFIGLELFDGYSTSRGIARGAVESNPLVRWSVGHPATLWAVKGAAAAGSIYVAERLWKRGRRARAITVMVLSNAVMGIVAARNVSAINASR